MILDDCQQLNEKIKRFDEFQSRKSSAESLGTRRKELEEVRASLQQSLRTAKVLAGEELLDMKEVASSTKVLLSLDVVQRLFQEDPLQITKGKDYNVLLTQLASLCEEIYQECRRVWDDFIEDATPAVDSELLNARAEIPDFVSIVKQIRLLKEKLDTTAENVPSTAEVLSDYRETAQALREKLDEFYSGEYPPEVIDFLKAANTRRGAALSLLTPSVLKWLQENDKVDGFSVRTTI